MLRSLFAEEGSTNLKAVSNKIDMFYMNPVVVPVLIRPEGEVKFPIAEKGMPAEKYLPATGISAHCLNHLLEYGLFDGKRSGALWCSPQRYRHQGEHPCDGHECPWIFLNDLN